MLLLAACAGGLTPNGGTGGGGLATGGGSGASAGGSGGGGAVVGLPVSSACSVLNARRCEYLERCGLIQQGSDTARRDCQAWLLSTWCGPTKWPARVAAGTLYYDGRLGQSCADSWAGRACEDFEAVPVSCTRMISPNVSPLQACYDGYNECTDNQVCRGAACPRSCQPLGAVGDSCQLDSDCRSLLYCKRAVLVTGAGTCENLGISNSVCGPDEPCAPAFTCVAGRCIVPPAVGAPCATGGICDESSWCSFSDGGSHCALRVGLNERCTDDVQCATGYLCQSGRCEPRLLAAVGAMCTDRQTCPTGTTCVGATPGGMPGSCRAPLDGGEPCIASDDCRKHLACASPDGGFELECGFRRPTGAACTVDRDCQVLSRCIGKVCMRLPVVNESCTDERVCLTGPCSATQDGGTFVCGEKLLAGFRCTADTDCASGRCVGSMCLTGCAP